MKKIILAFIAFFALASLMEVERNDTLETAQIVGRISTHDTNLDVQGGMHSLEDVDFFKFWVKHPTVVKLSVVTGGVGYPLVVGPDPEGGATFLPIVTIYNQYGDVMFCTAALPGALFIPTLILPIQHEFIYISIANGGEVPPPFISSDMEDVYILKIFQ